MMKTCTEEQCTAPVHVKKRGLCAQHYNRWYSTVGKYACEPRKEVKHTVPAFTCEGCGRYNPQKLTTSKARKARKYCNKGCNQLAHRAKASAERAGQSQGRTCKQCSADISDRKPQAKFCSPFCSDVSRGARLAAPLPERVCALDGCSVVFAPKSSRQRCCSENHGAIHCNRTRRAEGRELNSPWDERRKAAYHKRRAQKRGTQVEDIRPIDIYERDVWMCGLCDTAVDNELTYPHPMSASLDHVQPLSKGGTHTWFNLQLAHLRCNVSKGNKVAA